MTLMERIREHCAERRWYGPDALQDADYQLGAKRAMYEAGFQWPTATEAEVESAERELGFALPGLLRQLLREVANGDFGPSYGFAGVRIAAHAKRPVVTEIPRAMLEVIDLHEKNRERIEALLPPGSPRPPLMTRESALRDLNKPPRTLVDDYRSARFSRRTDGPWLQLVDWGCGMASVLHVPTDRVVFYEPNPGEYVASEASSLSQWLEAWLSGELLGQNLEDGDDGPDFFTGEDGRDPWRRAAKLDG
jgi:hypothetical protein